MATLGYTSTPGAGTFTVQSNTCQVAVQATMPTGGGVITSISAHFRTDLGSGTCYVCVWNSSGTLLASASLGTISNSGEQWFTGTLATPLYVAGGTGLYIGFTVPPSEGFVVEYDNVGNSYTSSTSSPPASATFGTSGFGTIGAYCTYYPAIIHIYRSGAWGIASGVEVYRSSAWGVAQTVDIERSSTWTTAT